MIRSETLKPKPNKNLKPIPWPGGGVKHAWNYLDPRRAVEKQEHCALVEMVHLLGEKKGIKTSFCGSVSFLCSKEPEQRSIIKLKQREKKEEELGFRSPPNKVKTDRP